MNSYFNILTLAIVSGVTPTNTFTSLPHDIYQTFSPLTLRSTSSISVRQALYNSTAFPGIIDEFVKNPPSNTTDSMCSSSQMEFSLMEAVVWAVIKLFVILCAFFFATDVKIVVKRIGGDEPVENAETKWNWMNKEDWTKLCEKYDVKY